MPRIKCVNSLQELTVENVAHNVDRWCKSYFDNYGADKLDRLDVVGPFDVLRKFWLWYSYFCIYRLVPRFFSYNTIRANYYGSQKQEGAYC